MFQIIYFSHIVSLFTFFILRFTHILILYVKFSENLKHSVGMLKYQTFSECEFSNVPT